LIENKLSFVIRIKNNTITTNSKGLAIDIDALFYGLQAGEQRQIKGKRKIWGHELYLTGLRLSDGELLIVASDTFYDDVIKIYGLRWQIETLFGCLKGRALIWFCRKLSVSFLNFVGELRLDTAMLLTHKIVHKQDKC
jgi:hypothetical protein